MGTRPRFAGSLKSRSSGAATSEPFPSMMPEKPPWTLRRNRSAALDRAESGQVEKQPLQAHLLVVRFAGGNDEEIDHRPVAAGAHETPIHFRKADVVANRGREMKIATAIRRRNRKHRVPRAVSVMIRPARPDIGSPARPEFDERHKAHFVIRAEIPMPRVNYGRRVETSSIARLPVAAHDDLGAGFVGEPFELGETFGRL